MRGVEKEAPSPSKHGASEASRIERNDEEFSTGLEHAPTLVEDLGDAVKMLDDVEERYRGEICVRKRERCLGVADRYRGGTSFTSPVGRTGAFFQAKGFESGLRKRAKEKAKPRANVENAASRDSAAPQQINQIAEVTALPIVERKVFSIKVTVRLNDLFLERK